MFKKLFSKSIIVLVLIIFAASFLRLYKITVDPPSLFGDELDLGYQALSILKTGKDYQGNFMPIHFHSLAEWRTPLYLYSAVPTVAIFGITPPGVRLPAAIFGILSVLGIYLLVKQLLSYGLKVESSGEATALISAALMAVNPWSLQYSRAGFEVTLMLALLLFGLWAFFKALKNDKYLWLSVLLFTLTPWVYSTAKLFTPILLVSLVVIWRKEIFSMKKSNLIKGVIVGLIVGVPIVWSTLFGGGSQRFNYISVFADPTTESAIGASRQMAARVRGELGAGLSPSFVDKVVYNKFTYWGSNILSNYLSAFSTNFLFVKGDPDPRQSIGIGEFYRIEIVALILGIVFFFSDKSRSGKVKVFVASWIIISPLASALTVDGANHATRLILLLPPLIILTAVGWLGLVNMFSGKTKSFATSILVVAYIISIFFYLHEYYTAYPWNSERWWHYGWGPAITEIKAIDSSYDKVIISMSGEPAWIFFAGWYQYPPALWQKEYPIGNDTEVPGFGKISHTGKYYFGAPSPSIQIYGLSRYIDSKTLYLANAKEVGANLIMEPSRVPDGLKMIKTFAFPSGEPAFYLFTGTSK